MGHPYHHALSSAKKWGGAAEDYLPIHQWFDESKAITADFRHRALRHLGHFASVLFSPGPRSRSFLSRVASCCRRVDS